MHAAAWRGVVHARRGCCSQGSTCTYLHRLPTLADEEAARKDMGADCFGREKRGEHEGYRAGAGAGPVQARMHACSEGVVRMRPRHSHHVLYTRAGAGPKQKPGASATQSLFLQSL